MEILEARAGPDSDAASLAAQRRSPLDIARVSESNQRTVAGFGGGQQGRLHRLPSSVGEFAASPVS
jgi:DNA-binding FadR family transcriptional regulator